MNVAFLLTRRAPFLQSTLQCARPKLSIKSFHTSRSLFLPRAPKVFSQRSTSWSSNFGRAESTEIPGVEEPTEAFSYKFSSPKILLPAVKVVAATLAIYGTAIYFTKKDAEHWKKVISGSTVMNGLGITLEPGWRELMQARFRASRDRWQTRATNLGETLKKFPKAVEFHVMRVFVIIANSWIWSGEVKQAAYVITGLNTVIFLASCVPRLTPTMARHFSHDVVSGKTYTMLTSMFGHGSFMHLAFNSIALISFSGVTAGQLVKSEADWMDGRMQAPSWFSSIRERIWPEATPIYHFVAFFLAAGLFSSLVSHTAKSIRLRRLMRDLTNPVKSPTAMSLIDTIRGSLGASGAIYSMVTFSALAMPQTYVNVLFIPVDIPITVGVSGMILMDICGILFRWRMFDHWAHLGGAAFGVLAFYDHSTWWTTLKALLS